MKLRQAVVLTAIAGLSLFAGLARSTPILIDVPGSPLNAGDSFTLTLQETNLADGHFPIADDLHLYNAEFVIKFDSTRLILMDISPNAALVASGDWTMTPDSSTGSLLSGYEFQAGGFFTSPPSGLQNLFTLTFQALANAGIANISLELPDGGVYGESSSYAPFTTSVTIAEAQQTVPEPPALALLALAGFGAGVSMRRRGVVLSKTGR